MLNDRGSSTRGRTIMSHVFIGQSRLDDHQDDDRRSDRSVATSRGKSHDEGKIDPFWPHGKKGDNEKRGNRGENDFFRDFSWFY